jgi:tetratricopeptide (TPR) repeat protein
VSVRHALFRIAASVSLLPLSGPFALAGPAASAPEVSDGRPLDARGEAQEGLRRYQARDFAGAQEHFERSLQLDPTSVETRLWMAHTLQKRFRISGEESERSELARQAMTSYQDVLSREPGRGEAYQALLALSRDADDAAALPWLHRQAGDATLPPSRRADAFQVLAARDAACAGRQLQSISDQPILSDSSLAARDCAARGLESIREALRLDPQRGSLWSEQARLLLALAQVCALQGQTDQEGAYQREAADSRRKAEQIRSSQASKGKPPRSY